METAKVNVFHRQGSGAYGHNTADDAAFDLGVIAVDFFGPETHVHMAVEHEGLGFKIS